MLSPQQNSSARAKARIGTVLDGKWHLDSLLGVGGSAAVYAATHRNGKRGAVKVLHPELSVHPDLVARFVREGYVANKIAHPGAVSVLDDDRAEDGSVYLVMELLKGYSLEVIPKSGRQMSVDEVLNVADQLLDVLSAAHAKGIVHRDIKPANLFWCEDGRLKVLDFGIARLAEATAESATQTGTPIGTPAFMPPEQARGRWSQVDARTDVWAVGATMMALLTGKRPRKADTANEELLLAMTAPLPKTLELVPHLPAQLAVIIDRAVAFEQSARWPNASAMQKALRDGRATIEEGTLMMMERPPIVAQLAAAAPHTPAPTPAPVLPMPRTGSAAPPSWQNDHALTTGRGVSAQPGTTIRPGATSGPLIAIAAIVAVASILGVVALLKYKGATSIGAPTIGSETATQTATAIPTPSPTPSPTPIPVPTASIVASASATATAPATATATATATSTSGTAAAKPSARPHPKPPGSAKPDDPFDQRF